ncbi:DUF883 family protein [Photorhabdus heterorhabditis]|uniref:DUF883 domain-containing protein n=2 Tax=Photorhabdus heterorhabditis TaxID=880156 RepID=A0A5B0WGQ1_9GAMM|nr:YqjD family protein [Photorhabdus heterorhabditis]KAA1186042.1 DUF883 domain-containing protein [Photorhabdus heterorhabditis]MBS9442856.1 DUF883 domain-containing protein [Photorhabdus heterorhabditis]
MMQNKTTEDLHVELKSLADTLEEVIKHSGDKSKVELEELRGKVEDVIKDTRSKLGNASDIIVKQTKDMAVRADDYVHDKPWTSIGIGTAVGAILGVLLAKR